MCVCVSGDECLDCRVRTAKEKGDKATLFLFLEGDTPAGVYFEYFTMFLILVNVVTFILGTEETIMTDTIEWWFGVLEVVTVVIFTIEYGMRTWTCLEDPVFNGSYWNYFTSFFSIVDLLAIVPFYVDLFLPQDLLPTTMIRVFRLFRLFKAEHYIESFTILDNVYARNKQLLKTCGFVALILWYIMAILFHICERDNPAMDGAFETVPNSLYFTAIFFGGTWA
jgi:voltage-gated potassium channel